MSDTSLATDFLDSVVARYRQYDQLAVDAIQQCDDAELTREFAADANSIAVIVKHMRGNMISRWTDFLTTDGEKPDRDRDGEFVQDAEVTRDRVLRWWRDGYDVCLASVTALRPEDLTKTITIRDQPLRVVDALHRNLTHTAYHVGQIVLLAKSVRGASWRSLSIPRGQSAQFTQSLKDQQPR